MRAGLITTTMVAMLISGPALAQANSSSSNAGVETVIVTAEKRTQDIQSIPASISAMTGEDLEKLNLTNAVDLQNYIPTLTINSGNNLRNTSINIRGIGTTGADPGLEPDVTVFIDGVYSGGADRIYENLLDISTVEVLNGPQGTLYGRNSIAGAVNITTRAPTQTPEAEISVDLGNYSERRVSGYVGGGISDTLAGRLSLFMETRDGYELNKFNHTRVNDENEYGGRAKLRWTPNANTTVDFTGFFTSVATHCCILEDISPNALGGTATVPGFLAAMAAAGTPFTNFNGHDHKVDDAQTPYDHLQSYGGNVTASYALGNGITLTSISAFDENVDNIPETVIASLPIPILHSNQLTRTVGETQEFRILSPGNQFIDYVGGVYLMHQDVTYLNHTEVERPSRTFPGLGQLNTGDASDLDYAMHLNSAAVYGQATANITDKIKVTGGLRYSVDAKRGHILQTVSNGLGPMSAAWPRLIATVNQPRQTRTDHSLTWLLSAQYYLDDDVMTYFTTSSGAKDGGIDSRAGAPPYQFGPERALNYEVGVKSAWLDRRLVFNIDAYRMLLTGFQQGQLNPLTPTGFVIVNAGKRTYQGIEASANAQPTNELNLSGAMSYENAVIDKYDQGPCLTNYPVPGSPPPSFAPQPNPAAPSSCDYAGFRPSGVPLWRWTFNARWEQPWKNSSKVRWFISNSLSGQSSVQLDGTYNPLGRNPAMVLWDAQIGLESEQSGWRVMLYGRNLTNVSYYSQAAAQVVGAFISAGGTSQAGGENASYAPPRTFGIMATYQY